MKNHLQPVGKNDEWITPQSILRVLGEFDLDPCSPIKRPFDTALKHYNITDDGLNKDWKGRVWLNPPFNRYQKGLWVKKMVEHDGGVYSCYPHQWRLSCLEVLFTQK